MRPRWMNFLKLVIIEKCKVKDIEIGQIMTMATRVDILENYFTNGQHNICVFQPVYFKFWTQEGSSDIKTHISLVKINVLLYSIYQNLSFLGLKA